MKRLLAYLFIVLGLGLTFSDNAEAKGICVEIIDNKFGEQLVKAEFSKINNNKISPIRIFNIIGKRDVDK